MAQVYSASFAQAAEVEGTQQVVVPAGEVWVLKDASLWCNQNTTGYRCFLLGYSGQVFFGWEGATAIADNLGLWSGRIVLQAGESFQIYVNSGSWDVSVCGYLLTTP
jgi:hypothetical protein